MIQKKLKEQCLDKDVQESCLIWLRDITRKG